MRRVIIPVKYTVVISPQLPPDLCCPCPCISAIAEKVSVFGNHSGGTHRAQIIPPATQMNSVANGSFLSIFCRQPCGEGSTKPRPHKLTALVTLSRYTVIVNAACTFVSCSSGRCYLQFERTKAIIGE